VPSAREAREDVEAAVVLETAGQVEEGGGDGVG